MGSDSFRTAIYNRYRTSKNNNAGENNDVPPVSRYATSIVKRFFPKDKNSIVLDLGCGNGDLVEAAYNAGYNFVTGVDNSIEQIDSAQNRGTLRITKNDIFLELNEVAESSIDVVVSIDIIEHLSKNEIQKLVILVYRALKNGGQWIVQTTNAESPFFGRIRYGDLTHELAFTTSSLKQLTCFAPFSDVHFYNTNIVVHGVKSLLRSLVVFVFRTIFKIFIIAETGSLIGPCITSANVIAVFRK